MSALVKARWVAPWEGELPDKTRLIPGQTVVGIGADEAQASEHWQVETPKPAKTDTDAAKTEE